MSATATDAADLLEHPKLREIPVEHLCDFEVDWSRLS